MLIPAAILAVYLLLLWRATEFTCYGGAYIGMGVYGMSLVPALAGVINGAVAARAAELERHAAFGIAFVVGVAIALLGWFLAYELTPLDGCYT